MRLDLRLYVIVDPDFARAPDLGFTLAVFC